MDTLENLWKLTRVAPVCRTDSTLFRSERSDGRQEQACDIPVRHWSEDLQVVKQFGSPEQARREDVRRVGGGSDRAS